MSLPMTAPTRIPVELSATPATSTATPRGWLARTWAAVTAQARRAAVAVAAPAPSAAVLSLRATAAIVIALVVLLVIVLRGVRR